MEDTIEMLYNLKDMLTDELKECAQHGSIGSSSELGKIDMLAHAAKNIDKLIMSEEFTGGGYARDGEYSGNYPERERYVYRDGGNSYRDDGDYSGRRRRDSRGRYSREEGKADASERIERMMRETNDPHQRDVLRQALEQLRGR